MYKTIRFYLVVTRNIPDSSGIEMPISSHEEIDILFEWDEKEYIMRPAFRALKGKMDSDDGVIEYHWNDW